MPDFRILGPLEVISEEGLVTLGGQKQRALIVPSTVAAPPRPLVEKLPCA